MLRLILLVALFLLPTVWCSAQYNKLWIPDTLSGTTFNLVMAETTAQLRPGNVTSTMAFNGAQLWGPTLFLNKGDVITMNVRNNLNEETTVHWHGFHLPAVMDGGPHQVVAAGALWQPTWKVKNNAATYWYHPHLHHKTQEHMTKGLGGFIIIRDAEEAALPLPRTYGVDDIPVVLTSRRYNESNQFVYENTAYGDYLLTNGTSNAEVTLPKQVVRLRILNAETERAYNLGFSDDRPFHIIATDGGLLDAPVSLTRVILGVGERIEILVDLGNDEVGSSIDLMAYNAGQTFGFPGGEPAQSGEFGSLLNNKNFAVLHLTVDTPTASPITSIPTALVTNTYWTESDATVSRTVRVTGGSPRMPFSFDHVPFDMMTINHRVNLNTTEKWTIVNNNMFSHSFHIHDVQFKITSRSDGPVGSHESGWKDVLYLPRSESATFVARFVDYADPEHPFMYHCHFANHEDEGMMGQFVVVDTTTSSVDDQTSAHQGLSTYPNPTTERLHFRDLDQTYHNATIAIYNTQGLLMLDVPKAELSNGINVSGLPPGAYTLVAITVDGSRTARSIMIKN